MATYWVSEPYINLRLEDEPLGYSASRGPRVTFHLSYRQRGAAPESSTVFGVGPNWSCSFRAYIVDAGGTPDILQLESVGTAYVTYTNGIMQYRDGSIGSSIAGGYQFVEADGSVDTYNVTFVDSFGETIHLLSTRADPAGNVLTFTYTNNAGIEQLSSVTDPDGRVTTLYYENSSFRNQITKVVDPYLRTNLLMYDSTGYLTNITDVIGLSSVFKYDAANPGWITNLTTAYGATGFSYGGVDANSTDFNSTGNVVNRWVQVLLPTGGTELSLFRQDCSGFMSSSYSSVPSTSPLGNTLDNVDQENRNSFHWTPLQYVALSTADPNSLTAADYSLGRLQHWLISPTSADASSTLSLSRAPTPDKVTAGQLTWYDYGGKTAGNNYTGTNGLPSFVALTLPDASTRYTFYTRNGQSKVSRIIETYSKTDGSTGLRTNTYTFAANNIDLLQQIGPNAEQVVSNYFSPGNIYHQPDASYDALNQQTAYTYNGNRQLTSVNSPTGLTTTNIYYSGGSFPNWLSTTIDLEIARTNTYTYNNGLMATHTDERGLSTTNLYDNLQRLTSVLYPDGTTISNRYTALDKTASKDRDGYWSYSGYNSIRQKVACTNANGVVTAYGYCTCGALSSTTNGLGTAVQTVTSYNYDFQGNLTYVYLPDETITNWFNALGQNTVTSEGWGYHTNAYNNQGLLITKNNAYGLERGTIYDNEERPLFLTNDRGVTITNTYDLLGRVVVRGYPDGGLERFAYSARGLVAYTNQIGMANFFGYDSAGRKTAETNANFEVLLYTNNAAGDLVTLKDGKGQITKWGYDTFGRVTNKTDQAGAIVLTYGYDGDGRLLSRWSAAMGTTFYTNDAVGNLTYIKYPLSISVRLQYDPLDRLTNMVDASGTTRYTYTSGNQLLAEIQPFASSTVTNTYVNRLRTSMVLQQPTGVWTNVFYYDLAGRLTNVTSPAGVFGYTLGGGSPASRLAKKIALPNTSYITNTFDPVARLRGTYIENNANSVLDSAVYGYNTAGQRTAFTNAAGTYVLYSYDNFGQVKVATSSLNSESRGYAYDSAWNVTYFTNASGSSSTDTYTVDSKNELTAVNGFPMSYDGNGNRVTNDSAIKYSYDSENRLTEVSDFVFHIYQSTFTYDGFGRLRQRIEFTWNGFKWFSSATVNYIYDGTVVIQERDGSNNPLVTYTRGTDLSGTLQGAGGTGGLLARSSGYSSGNWTMHHFYHADGNGNITYLEDSSQAMAAVYRYDPFGNTLASSGGPMAATNVYRFSSKEFHVASGMYMYLYRFYDPSVQRWLNRDPLLSEATYFAFRADLRPGPSPPVEKLAGANAYSFALNDPTDRFDLDGLSPGTRNPPDRPIGLSRQPLFIDLGVCFCIPWPSPTAPPGGCSIKCHCIFASGYKDDLVVDLNSVSCAVWWSFGPPIKALPTAGY
jgi:RHS repeat-associated protein